MSPKEKVLYAPSERKRFEVSSDPYSRERIRQLHDVYNEVKEALPEISIAFTLGGSLAKGKRLTKETANSTDIDLYIFIDENDVENNYREMTTSNSRFAAIYHGELEDLEEALKDNEFSTRKERERTAAWRAVKDIIYQSFQRELHDGSILSQLKDDHYSDRYGIAMRGPRSIIGILEAWEIERMDYDHYFPQPSKANLAHFFQLDIGGGMKKYIRGFLQKLGEMDMEEPGKAEEKWQTVKFVLEDVERNREIPEKVRQQYPQTFIEACGRYGVQLPE